MDIQEILLLAAALAIDAMLVSFSYGLVVCDNRLKNSLRLSFFFGLFQGLMPLFGWGLTRYVYNYIKVFSTWIVFAIFLILGLKFLVEAFFINKEEKTDCITLICILWLSIATSIDAFGAGVSLKLLDVDIIKASLIIGIITFLLSEMGFHCGNLFCKFSKKYVEMLGGLFLLYLAVKTLL